MSTAKEINLHPGDKFQHTNDAGLWVLGVVHKFDLQGNLHAWVDFTSSHAPVTELFPEGKVIFPIEDTGFSPN